MSRVFQLASFKFSLQREKKEEKDGKQYATRLRRKRPQEERKHVVSLSLSLFLRSHSAPLRPHPLDDSLLKNACSEHFSSSRFSSSSYFPSYLLSSYKRNISFAPIFIRLPISLQYSSDSVQAIFRSERTDKSPRLPVEELSCQFPKKLAEAERHAQCFIY